MEKKRISRQAKRQVRAIASREFETESEYAQELAKMMGYLSRLEEPFLTAIQLRYSRHLEYDEIATLLNKPIGTVKSYVRWGLGKLARWSEEADSGKKFAEIAQDINSLKEPYRTAVKLRYIDHLRHQEIAEKLNVPDGTAKSYISRGLTKLTQLTMQGENGDEQLKHTKILSDLEKRIDELDEPYRTTMYLRYIKQQSYVQIGIQLHAPIGTVKARISRGRRALGVKDIAP